jgi:GR25 family glycosyltransferase involved in LPS biosynthesis
MIALATESRNIATFKEWCTRRGQSHEVVTGCRVSDMAESKPHLTSYGYYVMNNWRETCNHFDTTGPIGCFLAHRTVWKQCVSRNVPVWVFEEGVESYDTAQFDRIECDYSEMDLVLGHTVPVLRRWWQRRINSHRIGPILEMVDKVYFGTKCYRISPRFAARLIQNSERFDVHVDTFLCTEAMYYNTEFKVARMRTQMVVAGSSGLINHSVDQTLLTVSCLAVSVIVSSCIIILVSRWYVRCKKRCPRS